MATAIRQDAGLPSHVTDFAEDVAKQAANIFRAYREVGTLTANGTVGFLERVPGEQIIVSVNLPHPFDARDTPITPAIGGLDGTVYRGRGGVGRYGRIFLQHPDITTVSHVHSPSLGA